MPPAEISSHKAKEPCKAEACAIQDCLSATGFNESKCSDVINKLYFCCKNFYEAKGPEASTTCCPKLNLLNLKLKQRDLDQVDAQLLETRRG